jgi:hypothetical protein
MTDPTLSTVDDEPWNQSPKEQRKARLDARRKAFAENAPIFRNSPVRFDSALSIGERVIRRIPISTPTGPARFVYDLSGHTTDPRTCECGASCLLSVWTELEHAPNDPITKRQRRDYRVVHDLYLCNTCSGKLKRLPLGDQWKGPK